VGEQDNTTASHMWVKGGGGGRPACGGCTQWHCYKGGLDAADKVERNGSFPQTLPLGSLDTKHPCFVAVVQAKTIRKVLLERTDLNDPICCRSKFQCIINGRKYLP